MTDVTEILGAVEQGDREAAERLLPLVYDELRQLAAAQLARESPGQTLQATALVHEAYLRLVKPDSSARFANRRHFFGAAAQAMRRILVEQARRKDRIKHGGSMKRVALPDVAADVGDYVNSLAWSPDGQLLALALGSEGAQIRDAWTGDLKIALQGTSAAPVNRVQFSQDGSLLGCAAGQSIVVWETDSGRVRDVFSQDGAARAVIFLPDGKRLATCDQVGRVRVWSLSPSKGTALSEQTGVVDAKYSPDGRYLATIAGGVVRLFEPDSEELVVVLKRPEGLNAEPAGSGRDLFVFGTPICFSPDGGFLAAANSDRSAIIYDIEARKPVRVLRGHSDTITDVTFSPDSKQLVTAGRYEGTRLRFWSTATGKLAATEEASADRELHSVDFSPDGKLLAYGDHSVHLWSVDKRELVRSVHEPEEATSVRFSPAGDMLACGNKNGEVTIYSVPSMERSRVFRGLSGQVRDLSYSPDGVNLLAISRGGVARIFNLQVMSEVGDIIRLSSDSVLAGEFSADGETLAVVSRRGGVRQFRAISASEMRD